MAQDGETTLLDVPAGGNQGDESTQNSQRGSIITGADDVDKESESTAASAAATPQANVPRKGTGTGPPPKTEESEMDMQRRFEIDVKETSASVVSLTIKGADRGVTDMPKPPPVPDLQEAVFRRAIDTIKKDCTEKTVIQQMENIWIMYEETQRVLQRQNAVMIKTRRTVEKLEEESRNDPRMMQAIYYADKNRREKNEMEKVNMELEAALKDRDEDVIPSLKERNKKLGKDLERVKDQLKQRDKQMEDFADREIAFTSCQIQLRQMSRQLVKQQEDCNQHEKDIISVFSAKEASVGSEQKNKINSLNRKIEKMWAERQAYVDEVRAAQDEKSRAEKALGLVEHKLAVTRSKLLKLEKARIDYEATLAENMKTMRTLENNKKVHEELIKAGKEDKVNMKKTLERNEIEIVKLKSDVKKYQDKIRLVEEEKHKMEEFAAEKQKAIVALLLQSQADKKDIENLNTELSKKEQMYKLLTSQLESITIKLNNAKSDIEHKELQRHRATVDREYQLEMTTKLEDDLGIKQRIIEKYAVHAQRLCRTVMEMSDSVAMCQDSNDYLKTYVENLEKKQDHLEDMLKAEEKQSFNCHRKNASQSVSLGILEDIIHQRDDEVNRNVNEINTLFMESDKLEKHIKQQDRELEKVVNNLTAKVRECTGLELLVHNLKNEIGMKQADLNQSNTMIAGLKERLRLTLMQNRDLERMKDYNNGVVEIRDAELKCADQRMNIAQEKMKTGQMVLKNSQNDVRMLIIEVKDLRRKLRILNEAAELHKPVKESYVRAVRQQIITEARLKALEEIRPSIIHPKTKLKASHPHEYELHLKIQHLTKQLIRKTTEVTEKESIILQMNQMYLELKTIIVRRGNQNQNMKEYWEVKKNLQSKERENKLLKAELNTSMYTASQAQRAMTDNKNQLDKTKKDLLTQKRILQSACRNSPQSTTGESPAQLLFGHKLRTKLDLLVPDLKSSVFQKQSNQVAAHSQAKPRQLEIGDAVLSRDYRRKQHRWGQGIIHAQRGPRAHTIKTSEVSAALTIEPLTPTETRIPDVHPLRPKSGREIKNTSTVH